VHSCHHSVGNDILKNRINLGVYDSKKRQILLHSTVFFSETIV